MFVIGLIVGIIIGLIAAVPIYYYVALKLYNLSDDEAQAAYSMLYDAAHDRESTLILMRNGEIEDEVVLEEQ